MRLKLHIAVLSLILGMLVVTTPKPLVSASALMAPPAPTLISPANGALMDNGCKPKADGITWDFDWSDVPGVTAYHLKVFRNPNIPLINNMNVPASSYHYVSAPHDHIINSNLNLWRWTVRAKVNGVWGPWSVMRGFRVEKLNTDCPTRID